MTKACFMLVGLLLAMVLAPIGTPSAWGAEANAQLMLSEAVTEAVEKNPEIQMMRQRLQVVLGQSQAGAVPGGP